VQRNCSHEIVDHLQIICDCPSSSENINKATVHLNWVPLGTKPENDVEYYTHTTIKWYIRAQIVHKSLFVCHRLSRKCLLFLFIFEPQNLPIFVSQDWHPRLHKAFCYYSLSTKKQPRKYNSAVFKILGKPHWNFYNRIKHIFVHCVQKFVEI